MPCHSLMTHRSGHPLAQKASCKIAGCNFVFESSDQIVGHDLKIDELVLLKAQLMNRWMNRWFYPIRLILVF